MALRGKIPDDILRDLVVIGGKRFDYDANGNPIVEYLVIDGKDFAKRTYTYDADGNLITQSEWEAV